MPPAFRPRRAPAFAVALAAGLAGLIDEILWARALSFRLGTTSFAAVLVVSMLILGWGVGALWAGRLRARTALVLLLSQGCAAAFSLLLPLVALGLSGGAGLLRDAFLVACVLAGGVPMGMAIPALLALPRASADSPRRLGGLNGWNGLGSLLGALLAGFFLLRWWGLHGASLVAAAVHLLAAGGGWWAARGHRAGSTPEEETTLEIEVGGEAPLAGAWLAFLAGFVILAVQLVATRWLMLYFLGFSYVFAAITGLALVAFGAGSFLGPSAARDPAKQERRILALLLLAACALGSAPLLLGILPGAATGAFTSWASGGMQLLGILLHAGALIFVPVFALAGVLPMAYSRLRGTSCARGAKALFWNGLGAAAAPWLGSLVAIPLLGSLRTWLLLAVALLASAAVLALGRGGWPRRAVSIASAGAALAALAVTVWPGLLSSERLYRLSPVMRAHPEFLLRCAGEDANFAVAVVDDGRRAERTLFTDNFRAAGTGDDYVYMRYLGTLPLHLEPRPERVLVIAFGTGTTAGTVAASDQVKELDIVEISAEVKDVREYFHGVNGPVDEVRAGRQVRWHVTDGRRYLEATGRRFDAISLEPLLPYAPAAVHLYTREFYELVRSRLDPGGTLTHWIPATGVSPPEVAALVRTFADGFEHAGLWLFGPSLVLVGSQRPLRFARDFGEDPTALTEALSYLGDRAAMRRLPEHALVTDAYPWIEFHGTRPAFARLRYFHDNLVALLAIYTAGAGELYANWPSPEKSWQERRAVQEQLLRARLREERERLDLQARGRGLEPPFVLEGPDAIALYQQVNEADRSSPVITAEYRRALYTWYLQDYAARLRRTVAQGAMLYGQLRPVLEGMHELARRASLLRPHRFEAWLYLGAAEYLLAKDPDLGSSAVEQHFGQCLRAWLCAAAIYPRCFGEGEARALMPLLGSVDRGGAVRLMEIAARRGMDAAQARPVVTVGELRGLLEASRGGERYGEAWLRAFRSVQVERALWGRLYRSRGGEFPREYSTELLGPR